MCKKIPAVDILTQIFADHVKKTLHTMTQIEIDAAQTVISVPKVTLRPAIGCFVNFSGDYNGLLVMNFSAGAAMEIYTNYMLNMGMPEEELARNFTSQEVPDCIGEVVNQIIGQTMQKVELEYELNSFFGQPKPLALNNAITLTIESEFRENRRVAFKVNEHKFYLEIAVEACEFLVKA